MKKILINSFWSDESVDPSRSDGVFEVQFPKELDIKLLIKNTWGFVEDSYSGEDSTEILEKYGDFFGKETAKKLIEENVAEDVKCNYGSSLEGILYLLNYLNDKITYKELFINYTFDMDYGVWED